MAPTISEIMQGGDCFQVLTLMGQGGQEITCKWEKDSNPYQVAAALDRLVKHLRTL